jgi:hypothetical protein
VLGSGLDNPRGRNLRTHRTSSLLNPATRMAR